MGRKPCCEKIGLNRGPWTIEEDQKLASFILINGIHCWRMVPKLAGLLRCGKSCRLRWINYLRPDVKRGDFTETEEDQIIELHSRLGNKWSKIASHLPGRTDNEIKNHWNTKIKKKMKLLGLDPVTHKPTGQTQRKTDLDVEKKEPQQEAQKDPQKDEEIKIVADAEYCLSDLETFLMSPETELYFDSSLSSSSSLEENMINPKNQWIDPVEPFLPWDQFYSIDLDDELFKFGSIINP